MTKISSRENSDDEGSAFAARLSWDRTSSEPSNVLSDFPFSLHGVRRAWVCSNSALMDIYLGELLAARTLTPTPFLLTPEFSIVRTLTASSAM